MYKVKIKKRDWTDLTLFDNFIRLEFENKLNEWSKGKMVVSLKDSHINNDVLKLMNIVEIYKDWNIKEFEWYIYGFNYTNDILEFIFIDYIEFLKKHILRVDLDYDTNFIKDIVEDIYNYFNGWDPLPFALWKNDITDTASFYFKTWQSFYDILKKITDVKWEFRIVDWQLDFSETTWDILTWIFKYDINNLQSSNIEKYNVNINLNNVYNVAIISDWQDKIIKWDTSSINELWFIEQYFYSPDWDINLNTEITKIPQIEIRDGWKYKVWDRQQIYINPWFNYLAINYLWTITRKYTIIENWFIRYNIDIANKYRKRNDLWSYLNDLDWRVKKLEL